MSKAEQLTMVKTPDKWPRWPILPVVHLKDYFRCGIMLAGQGPKVYDANMMSLPDDLSKVKFTEYDDFEGLLMDWRVD